MNKKLTISDKLVVWIYSIFVALWRLCVPLILLKLLAGDSFGVPWWVLLFPFAVPFLVAFLISAYMSMFIISSEVLKLMSEALYDVPGWWKKPKERPDEGDTL